MPELVKNDPWWTDPKRDLHVPPYVEQGLVSPTKPDYFAYNPAWAQVRSEHPFHVAFHDIVADGMPLKEAADKAMKRVERDLRQIPDQGLSGPRQRAANTARCPACAGTGSRRGCWRGRST